MENELSVDPYEQKLFQMFNSYDREAIGCLDQAAVQKLCATLELKDRADILVAFLMNGNKSKRVTFKEFKEGLLNLLGSEDVDEANYKVSHNTRAKEAIRNLSPSREVSPKFVVGSKKYGRRSRPRITESSESSESDNELIEPIDQISQQKVHRSASQSDIHGLTKRRRPFTGTKLKRCASLPSQKEKKSMEPQLQAQRESSVESLGHLDFENLSHSFYEQWHCFDADTASPYLNQSELTEICNRVGLHRVATKVAEEVFEKLSLKPDQRISFNDFISLIQNEPDTKCTDPMKDRSIIASHDTKNCNNDTITPTHEMHVNKVDWMAESSSVSVKIIIEMWESAGIINASNLLKNLGFSQKEIHISQLAMVIDDELNEINEGNSDSATPLLRASLALHKAEVNALQQAFKQLAAENKKLRTNNHDTNRRAALLAQEVDERHATLESAARNEIRQLEQRHAEIVRDLTNQLANDREHWSNLNTKLESRIKCLETDDVKHKSDMSRLQSENSALEMEQISLQKQITELLETTIKLNHEIVEVEERQKDHDNRQGCKETEEVLELMDKITLLQIENSNLRDKNDELITEIEDLNLEMGRLKQKKSTSRSMDSSFTTDDGCTPDILEHSSAAIKRRGDSPSKAKISDESPRLGKLRKCSNDSGGESETSGDWIALNSELNQSGKRLASEKDLEIQKLQEKLDRYEKEITDLRLNKTVHPSDSERIMELEASLDQMRKEYEDCEDYWQSKLNEERQLYEEEQRCSDEKFNELLKKMTEYEEQFAAANEKDGRLSPIEEKCVLEQQYADLEMESEQLKETTRKILNEKDEELRRLTNQVTSLRDQCGHVNESRSPPPKEAAPNMQSPLPGATSQKSIADMESPASSPISYLWHQSTIQAPARDYHNPNWRPQQNQFAVNPDDPPIQITIKAISPIQRPASPTKTYDVVREAEQSDGSSSNQSFRSQSVASTHSVHRSLPDPICSSFNNGLRDEIKQLKVIQMQLHDEVRDLAQHRDGLVMEMQQLQSAKPVLEKAYARSSHPSLMQRISQLEQRNRHLQNCLKQQQNYTENVLHQTWYQQRSEIAELHSRLETQGILIAEQAQRLTNADILVKDLYVENSQLTAANQRLEQQRARNNLILQHQGLTGVPGMP